MKKKQRCTASIVGLQCALYEHEGHVHQVRFGWTFRTKWECKAKHEHDSAVEMRACDLGIVTVPLIVRPPAIEVVSR
jgi:hypothetical protein